MPENSPPAMSLFIVDFMPCRRESALPRSRPISGKRLEPQSRGSKDDESKRNMTGMFGINHGRTLQTINGRRRQEIHTYEVRAVTCGSHCCMTVQVHRGTRLLKHERREKCRDAQTSASTCAKKRVREETVANSNAMLSGSGRPREASEENRATNEG